MSIIKLDEFGQVRIDKGSGGGGGGGGTSMNFYRCASVGTGTWTGYKATYNAGFWSYASTATSGLPYRAAVPVVGKVYTEDCSVLVSDLLNDIYGPQEGLLLYYPFAEDLTDHKGPTTATPRGSAAFSTYHGIPACYLTDRLTISDVVTSGSDYTATVWVNPIAGESGQDFIIATGTVPTIFWRGGGKFKALWGGWGGDVNTTPLTGSWNFIKILVQNRYGSAYVNGTEIRTSGDADLGSVIGLANDDWSRCCEGYYAGLRIYNRKLTDDELAVLASEFTPSAS